MTERNEALQALMAKIEAGSVQDWRCFMRGLGLHPDDRTKYAGLAYNGSLDAAKALHESVLSDEWTAMLADWGTQNEWTCQLSHQLHEPIEAGSKCPARAWLIAIIKALIAQEPTTN